MKIMIDVNDYCRLCQENLRLKGTLNNTKKIFDLIKNVNEKNVYKRLFEIGVRLRYSSDRSIRICLKCFRLLGRVEESLAILRKWQASEQSYDVGTTIADKCDWEPTPSKTLKVNVKLTAFISRFSNMWPFKAPYN